LADSPTIGIFNKEEQRMGYELFAVLSKLQGDDWIHWNTQFMLKLKNA